MIHDDTAHGRPVRSGLRIFGLIPAQVIGVGVAAVGSLVGLRGHSRIGKIGGWSLGTLGVVGIVARPIDGVVVEHRQNRVTRGSTDEWADIGARVVTKATRMAAMPTEMIFDAVQMAALTSNAARDETEVLHREVIQTLQIDMSGGETQEKIRRAMREDINQFPASAHPLINRYIDRFQAWVNAREVLGIFVSALAAVPVTQPPARRPDFTTVPSAPADLEERKELPPTRFAFWRERGAHVAVAECQSDDGTWAAVGEPSRFAFRAYPDRNLLTVVNWMTPQWRAISAEVGNLATTFDLG